MIKGKYIIISVVSLFLLLALVLGVLKRSHNESKNLVKSPLEVSDKSSSWGEIDYDGGEKIAEFTIKNTGNEPVYVYELRTSCMCTQVQMLTGLGQSPKVRMIDYTGWHSDIKPQELATIQVIFEPDYHGLQGLGDIKRVITLKTNAEGYEQLEFTVDGTVVKK